MPKNESQTERVANATPLMAERFAAVAAILGPIVPFHMNYMFFEKNDVDAVASLRKFLADTGIHDYEIQAPGAENSKVPVPADFLWVDRDGEVTIAEFTVNLYRSDNRRKDPKGRKGDPRFSISRGDTRDRISEDNFVVFARSSAGKLLLLNVSEGLDHASLDSALWLQFLASAARMAGISESHEAEGVPASKVRNGDASTSMVQGGQGFVQDQKLKAVIEEYAVEAAKDFYCDRGAVRIEVLGKPYDLLVSINDEQVHVEVKGSRRDLDSVFVTRNEVAHARSYLRTELLVVDRIEARMGELGAWSFRGGRIRHWENWKPSDESLTAMQYSHGLSRPDGTEHV